MTFGLPGPLKLSQFKRGVAPLSASGGAAGFEAGVTGAGLAERSTGVAAWLTPVAAGECFGSSATWAALGRATVVTLFTLDPEIDAGAPQAARHRAAAMAAMSFFTVVITPTIAASHGSPRRQIALALTWAVSRPSSGASPHASRSARSI
jgi:hypothetical protein